MTYESLVTFPKIFRKMAAELKPQKITASDCLALLIARHWLEQRGERYMTLPFEMSETGGLQLKAAIRRQDPIDIKIQWMCRIVGVEGTPAKVSFRLPMPMPPAYTHVWLWQIAREETGEQYAHHWFGKVADVDTWETDEASGDRVLALKTLLDQSPG